MGETSCHENPTRTPGVRQSLAETLERWWFIRWLTPVEMGGSDLGMFQRTSSTVRKNIMQPFSPFMVSQKRIEKKSLWFLRRVMIVSGGC